MSSDIDKREFSVWFTPPSSGLILVCDNDGTMRKFCQQSLNSSGWRAITAADGVEAFKIFEENQREINLLVTDVQLPILNGVDLVYKARTLSPNLKVLFTSSYPSQFKTEDFKGLFDEGTFHLEKPFGYKEFTDLVKEMMK